ncbi:ParB/RepB/Spo0J family partition protein [Gymnodinialimonas ceratoperidinii]|uniref:ParB/RepB/Spo0J family partition protein n=1 Tax=Gymnodinialimonas ceratoperidinii TaxID=2856823 RepID=A0A8F6TYF2_9RHOB|nr:ParB/RepB/Spo0J family partition protein [Gymnodinialimonas ceratoperidinii]QXT40006.1 ParB/RepB/Spo0J family partition protein [Gymnodinialimonas ceratoperidinii]
MAKTDKKRGLGRGLSALMADIEPKAAPSPSGGHSTTLSRGERAIPVEQISPNPDQPRRRFSQSALDELAASIKEKGIIQPLILRPDPADASQFQIVAGERRWRAAQIAQLHEVPAIVREFNDTEVLEVAIIENIQRADLNAVEEAQGYRQLMEKFGHTQEQLATAMGKSRSHLANTMRLLQLPDEIQTMLQDGKLSAGHARALITSSDPVALARRAVKEGMSVREVEKAAKAPAKGKSAPKQRSKSQKDADTRILEDDLSRILGMGVVIDHDTSAGGGKLSIKYNDLSQLDDLLRLLNTN